MVAMADAGITRLAASYLFMRPAIRGCMAKYKDKQPLVKKVLEQYAVGKTTTVGLSGTKSTIECLPAAVREAGYRRLSALCKQHHIELTVCHCKNNDLVASGDTHNEGDADIEDLAKLVGACRIAGPVTDVIRDRPANHQQQPPQRRQQSITTVVQRMRTASAMATVAAATDDNGSKRGDSDEPDEKRQKTQ